MSHVEPIPAFQDNYIWLLHEGGRAHVVDPGDATAVLEALHRRQLTLETILLTHHHFDHTGGVEALKQETGCSVVGPKNPAISGVDRRLAEGDEISVAGRTFRVIEVPGHTLDHIAYFSAAASMQQPPLLFCGDTLFAAGCGRIFEGDPPTMYTSLRRLASLPQDTRVYCAHEYTLANLAFASAADPDNLDLQARVAEARGLRARNEPTVPSTLGWELATNPFLRSSEPGLRAALHDVGRDAGSSPLETFAALRAWKDEF